MRTTLWMRHAAAAAMLLFAGCNLFNPSGEGETGDLVAQGEKLYRDRHYAEAMAMFEKAIAQDSNRSVAYYDYAKATVKFYGLSKLSLLNDLDSTKGNDIAFLNHDDSMMSQRLRAGAKVQFMVGLLTNRDTLTRWYNYLRDSTSAAARADTLRDARIDWIRAYLAKADSGVPGYRSRDKFPLTDFRMPYDQVLLDFAAYKMMYMFTRLYDLDKNDTIDARDAAMKEISFGKNGGFSIDSLSKIADDLQDSTTAQNFNSMIQNMESGVLDLSTLVKLISQPAKKDGSDTSTNANKEASGNLDSVVASLGNSIAFYQFGDQKDNDGDGCIDEEVLDDKDNDGDGYVDEDARLTVLTTLERVDNDRNGLVNDFDFINGSVLVPMEDTVGVANTNASQPYPYVLAFVHKFYTQNPDSTGKFIKIKKGDANLALRIKIQKDSLATKSAAQLRGELKPQLDSAKMLVGGCWRNYPDNLDVPPARRAAR